MMEFDQHHPVCAYLVASQLLFLSRIHPSSAEEGTPDSTLARPFVHTFYDRAYRPEVDADTV